MDSSILKKAGKYLSERKKRRRYKEMVSILVIAVMFSVIFVLAMPASTLEKEAYCGIEEHVHTDECYERVLVCGYEEDPAASAANQILRKPKQAQRRTGMRKAATRRQKH